MSLETKRLLRKIHRWGGLLVAAFVLFYALTGILLNHRKAFGYFYRLKIEKTHIAPSDTKKIREFVEHYKSLIKRQDDPTVIKIKGSDTVEFLYGSHGFVRYIIKPEKGEIVRTEKVFIEPLNRLNNVLHKAAKTSNLWVVFSDVFSAVLVISTITGLFIFRYRKVDIFLLVLGVIMLVLLAVIV
jgi:hypothetical protein